MSGDRSGSPAAANLSPTAMQWDAIPGLRDGFTPEDVVAWIRQNGGEARYEPSPLHCAEPDCAYLGMPRVEVRTRDGWRYCLPGQTVVMGEWFHVKRTALSDYAVREFTVSDERPDGAA